MNELRPLYSARTRPRMGAGWWAVWAPALLVGCAERGAQDSPTTEPSIRLETPADGARVGPDSVRVTLTAAGVEIVPAGTGGDGTGHHHLLLNVDPPAQGQPVPTRAGYTHLGKAQTEHWLTELEPGEYRLIALLGDASHFPHDPPIADTVTFTVVPQ